MSDKSASAPDYDDRLRHVQIAGPEPESAGFTIKRINAMEKPSLEEALVEPQGGSACSCNSVCACVPVNACGCDSVCGCDAVDSCPSDCGCAGNCCIGVGWAPC